MTEKQKKFPEAINEVMPRLTELEREKLLAFGERWRLWRGSGRLHRAGPAHERTRHKSAPPGVRAPAGARKNRTIQIQSFPSF